MVGKVRVVAPVVALAAGAATAVVSVLPFVHFVYRSVSMHVAIETAAGIIALLAGILVFSRAGRRHQAVDLWLLGAFSLLALTNLAFSTAPAIAAARQGVLASWAPVVGSLLASLAFLGAAYARDRPVRITRRATAGVLALCVGLLGITVLVLVALRFRLPLAVDPHLSPESSGRPRVIGNPAVLAMQASGAVLYAAVVVGFVRRAERERDELMAWIAVAATLLGFSRLNYFLFPSVSSEFVYTGDLFKLVAYATLLVGAAREIQAYNRDLAQAAAFEERRRMARDLHDGLAQELAYIVTETRRLALAGEPNGHIRVVSAAERALNESRGAISALTRPIDQSFGEAVAQAAEEVAARTGTHLSFDLDETVQMPFGSTEPLLRIVREAVSNAARHGHAKRVWVELTPKAKGGAVLRVRDDGRGFDCSDLGVYGFGITSMTERARIIGGELHLASRPGAGASVEVTLP